MHIKTTRRSVPTWPEPSPLSVIVVQLSMLTLTALAAVANTYSCTCQKTLSNSHLKSSFSLISVAEGTK